LPIGLASCVPLIRDVGVGQCVSWADVRIEETDGAVQFRREMERTCS
jgi:predicted homoserine dehydrogenase-like protein